MSVYKPFITSDVVVSPFKVNKSFTFKGNELTGSNVEIDRYIGRNVTSSLWFSGSYPTGQINTQDEILIYRYIRELYYSNYLTNPSGSPAGTASFNTDGTITGPAYTTNYYNYLSTTLPTYRYIPTESNATTSANKAFQEYANQNVKPPNPLSSSEISNIMKTFGVSPDASQSGSDKPKEPKKVEGFALQPAAFADSKIIDVFGETPAGPQCFGNSGGYSKSLGPLCMTPSQIKLLSTRGGNISGNDSTIGH